jgi:hypothetical protein
MSVPWYPSNNCPVSCGCERHFTVVVPNQCRLFVLKSSQLVRTTFLLPGGGPWARNKTARITLALAALPACSKYTCTHPLYWRLLGCQWKLNQIWETGSVVMAYETKKNIGLSHFPWSIESFKPDLRGSFFFLLNGCSCMSVCRRSQVQSPMPAVNLFSFCWTEHTRCEASRPRCLRDFIFSLSLSRVGLRKWQHKRVGWVWSWQSKLSLS